MGGVGEGGWVVVHVGRQPATFDIIVAEVRPRADRPAVEFPRGFRMFVCVCALCACMRVCVFVFA